MAAGTVSYDKPQYGSLASALGEKVGSAINMAATARKRREDEIQELQETKNKTPEQETRLQDLLEEKEKRKQSVVPTLFTKAMGAEFGGDRMRRTMGFFQKDPDEANDPALTKAQRFEAMLSAPPKQGVEQKELDLQGAGYREQSPLDKLTNIIALKFKEIGSKIDGLRNQEQADRTANVVVQLADSNNGAAKYFIKNNEIQEETNKISNEQLANQIKAADKAEASSIETSMERRDSSADGLGFDNERARGKGIIGSVLDMLGNLLGGRGGRGGLGGLLGRRGGRRGRNKMPRMTKNRAYTAPIGPQPRGSATPWARSKGARGGMGGFLPRLASRALPGRRRKFASGGVIDRPEIKMASGGVLDNPTDISGQGDQAIIPKAQLTNSVKTNPENQKKAGPFSKAMMLPTVAAGSLLLSTITNVIKNMGGVGKMFLPMLQKFIAPAATAFGLPGGLIAGMLLGGAPPAEAHPGPEAHTKKGASSAPAVQSATPGGAAGFMTGGMVTGGGSVDGYRMSSPFGPRNTGIAGASTNHLGVDYAIPQGTNISLKKGGKVIETTVPAMGNMGAVYIQHDDGSKSRYLHMSKVSVTPGQTVMPGSLIGLTGGQPGTPGAGPTNGPHLHFEYYPPGRGASDGSGVASQYFSVGGQVTPTAVPPPPVATPQPRPALPFPAPGAAGPTWSRSKTGQLMMDFSTNQLYRAQPPVQDMTRSIWSVQNPQSPFSSIVYQ